MFTNNDCIPDAWFNDADVEAKTASPALQRSNSIDPSTLLSKIALHYKMNDVVMAALLIFSTVHHGSDAVVGYHVKSADIQNG